MQRSVFDRFMEHFETAVRGVVVTDPRDEAAEMGPLISAGQRETVRSYVEDAAEDVDVAFRGDAPEGAGYWYPADRGPAPRRRATGSGRRRSSGRSSPSCRSTTRPTRSPRPTTRHTASRGRSGRATSAAALRVARGVEAGNLSVNSHSSVRYSTPFGGFKQSGIGRELGPDALDAFTEVKNVFISTD